MEEWKFVQGSDIYQVSTQGRVRSVGGITMRRDGKPYSRMKGIMAPAYNKNNGYYTIHFYENKKPEWYTVHRLILSTFNPVEGMDKLQVNHKNGIKTDNRLENLEWCTRKENSQHAMKMGLFRPQDRAGEMHPMCKLSDQQVEEIRSKLCGVRGEQRKLAREYGVSEATISEIKTGRSRSRK